MQPDAHGFSVNRRAFLDGCAVGLGALACLLGLERARTGEPPTQAAPRGLAPRPPRNPARACSVICLFQHGGPSRRDPFDPEPELARHHRRPHPALGRSGREISELLPHTASIADEITPERSMVTDAVARVVRNLLV